MPYFIIVDTETTCENTVADFAAVVCDNKGNIVAEFAALVLGEYDRTDLFYLPNGAQWSRDAAVRKQQQYEDMLDQGTRIMATPAAINRWLVQQNLKYSPTLTAYNLAFDADKCNQTKIDIAQFQNRFCLWHAAVGNICNTKKYRQFALDNHLFNKPSDKGNMTFQTNAEAVFGFINGAMMREPHTALEDARDFELPILMQVVKHKGWRDRCKTYAWQDFQVRDHFKAR